MDFRPHSFANRQGIKPSYTYQKKKVIWLNSAYADDINNGNEYDFNVSPFQLYNTSSLKPITFVSENKDKSFNILKIKDLIYDNTCTITTDKKEALLLAIHTGVEEQRINNQYSLTLLPQQVSKITLINEEIINPITYSSYSSLQRYPPNAYNSFTNPVLIPSSFNNRPAYYHKVILNDVGSYDIWTSTIYTTGPTTNIATLFNHSSPSADNEAHWGSSQYNTNGTYKASSGNYLGENSYMGDWVVIKMINPIVVTNYQIFQRTSFVMRSPKAFKIYGSMDGNVWDIIDTVANAVYVSNIYSRTITNKKAYLYYGMVVNALMGNDSIMNWNEWVIKGYEILSFRYPEPENWFEAELSDPYYNLGKNKLTTLSLTNANVSITQGFRGQYAFNFNGINAYLYDGTYRAMGSQSFSFSCWSKRSQNDLGEALFAVGSGTTSKSNFHAIYMPDNSIRFSNYYNNLNTSTTFPDAGKWVHLVFTFETSSGLSRVYYNGEIVLEGVMEEITPNSTFYIGRFLSIYYLGVMEDIRIYYKSLSPSEVSFLYNEKPQLQFPPKTADNFLIATAEENRTFNNTSCYGCDFVISNASYGNGTYKTWYSSVAYIDTTQNRSPVYLFDKSLSGKTPNLYFNNYNSVTGNFQNNTFSPTNPIINDYVGEWIIIQMPLKMIMKSYNFIPSSVSPNRAPRDYRIYGSNNETNWNLIIEESNVLLTEYTTNGNYYKSLAYNYQEYSYYLLVVKAVNIGGSSLAFTEWIIRAETLQSNFIVGLEIQDSPLIIDNSISPYK